MLSIVWLFSWDPGPILTDRMLDEEERQVSRTVEIHKKEGAVVTKTGMRMKLVLSAVEAHVGACEL